MQISLDAAKAIYREAIDARTRDVEGAAWWDEVADEMRDVIAARTLADAAALIEWWHHDGQRYPTRRARGQANSRGGPLGSLNA